MGTIGKPEKKPRWATGASAAVVEPSEAKKDLGWVAEKPPHDYYNWLHLKGHEWIEYFELPNRFTNVISGKAKTSGYPQYLSAGGGSNKFFNILGATTPLKLKFNDGVEKLLEADLQSADQVLAPSTNNTATITDTSLTGQQQTKYIGEYGYRLALTAIGSEITALDQLVQAYIVGTEIFLARFFATQVWFPVDNMVPLRRGIAETARGAISSGAGVTLLKAHYIFLDVDLTTIDTTQTPPVWSDTAPAGPATGDYWRDLVNETWKEYDGAVWQTRDRVYLGMAICDDTGCINVDPVDFDMGWDESFEYDRMISDADTTIDAAWIYGPVKINVAGKEISNQFNIRFVVSSLTQDAGDPAVATAWNYIYMDRDGGLIRSNAAPRRKDFRKGYYHYREYWRCVGMYYLDGSGDYFIEYSPKTGILGMSIGRGTNFDTYPNITISGFPPGLSYPDIPPLLERVSIFVQGDLTAGATVPRLLSVGYPATFQPFAISFKEYVLLLGVEQQRIGGYAEMTLRNGIFQPTENLGTWANFNEIEFDFMSGKIFL